MKLVGILMAAVLVGYLVVNTAVHAVRSGGYCLNSAPEWAVSLDCLTLRTH